MATSSAAAATVRGSLRAQSRDWAGTILQVVLILSLLFTLATLLVLVYDQLTKALPVFGERGLDFLTSGLSSNPAKAGPGTIRKDFGLDIQQNAVHGSDSVENAEKEIRLFFAGDEIFDY
jgi:ABC-type phosphate transport system permease subunit